MSDKVTITVSISKTTLDIVKKRMEENDRARGVQIDRDLQAFYKQNPS